MPEEYSRVPARIKFVLLFEGTGCRERNPSAMSRLFDTLKDTRTQRKHVVNGSGTRGGLFSRLYNSVTGRDSFEIVREQYEWLTYHVQQVGLKNSAVELYIFGFSRGGFQAQMFVDIISRYGLPAITTRCRDIVSSYKNLLCQKSKSPSPTVSNVAMIKYIGLIDPVRAIFPGRCYGKNIALPETLTGRCALSIHEVRKAFKPKIAERLYKLECEWFGGVHSDVGYAYNGRRCTKTLGILALKWIVEPVENALEFIAYVPKIPRSFHDMIMLSLCYNFLRHKSLVGGWRILGKKPRNAVRRHITVRAVENAYKHIGIEPPLPFAIWPFPSRWFQACNRKRLHLSMQHILANRTLVEIIFKHYNLY